MNVKAASDDDPKYYLNPLSIVSIQVRVGDEWVDIVWACILMYVWLRGRIRVGVRCCEVQQVARCSFLLPNNLIKTCMCVLQCELSGGSVSRSGVDHVEFHHIPPTPCSRKSHCRGAGHQQETQLAVIATEKEKERSVLPFSAVNKQFKNIFILTCMYSGSPSDCPSVVRSSSVNTYFA